MRRKDILDIVKVLLDHLEEEEMCDLCGFEYEEDLGDECDECEEDEEWEEITEHVKDNSPETLKEENKKLKEKNEEQAEFIQSWYNMYRDADEERMHLHNLIDMICDVFGLEQYETNGKLAVSWDKGLVEEIAKARKKLKK